MKKLVTITLAAVVALGATGAGVWLFVQSTQKVQTQQHETTTPTGEQTEKTILVSLPGAYSVEARLEDYNDPTSLWVVVNKNLPLRDQQYRPTDLTLLAKVSRTDKNSDERSLRTVAVADFNDLIAAANAAGYDLIIGSGFRSYALQATYYNNYVAVSGEQQANKYSAKPGQSEHQTGLTADISLRSMQCYLDACFGDTPAGKWLAANAAEYGFIIRYPAEKTEVTKYQYEPWHIRYVGKPLAKALKQSGLTLDEAYPYLQATRSELLTTKKITAQ